MRAAVFTGHVDDSISQLWNRITLSIRMECLPSQIDNELSTDIHALKVILSAQDELNERNKGG